MLQDFKPTSILVLCTGNICRSPMAEVMLQAAFEPMSVSSAGVGALVGHGADTHAVDLMAERGLDLTLHQARAMTGSIGAAHDLIFTMSMEQRSFVERRWPLLQGRVFTLGHFDDADIADPFRHGEAAFRMAMEAIDRGIKSWRPFLEH